MTGSGDLSNPINHNNYYSYSYLDYNSDSYLESGPRKILTKHDTLRSGPEKFDKKNPPLLRAYQLQQLQPCLSSLKEPTTVPPTPFSMAIGSISAAVATPTTSLAATTTAMLTALPKNGITTPPTPMVACGAGVAGMPRLILSAT